MLETKNATLAYHTCVIADNVSISIPEDRITAIIGPNGSGKSTLLRALARLLVPKQGAVLLDGMDIHHWPTNEVAKRLAMLPQAPHAPDGLTVWNLVAFGRFPYRGWFGREDAADGQPIRKALDEVGLCDFANRSVHTLSGGQRQRVWIAMALAQETQYLLLDEPTTFLDLVHQMELMDLIRRLKTQYRKTIVLVLHDLNLAARYADHIVVLDHGDIQSQGTPPEVLTPDLLRRVFQIEAHVFHEGQSGAIVCVPLRAVENAA